MLGLGCGPGFRVVVLMLFACHLSVCVEPFTDSTMPFSMQGGSCDQGEGGAGEGGQRRSKVYPGGGRSGKLLAPGSGKSKKELNLLKRKGKGVKQFKSKARHKRRR